MKCAMVLAVVLTVARVSDAAEPRQLPVIHLEMANDAKVPAAVLKRSLDEVARIFAGVGLAVEWTEAGPRFTVQIATNPPQSFGAAPTLMGRASRTPTDATAQIFFDPVQELASSARIDVARLLAYVVAHEVGHLLLPQMQHSLTGLMKADWDSDMLREAAVGSLTFTGSQIKRLHEYR